MMGRTIITAADLEAVRWLLGVPDDNALGRWSVPGTTQDWIVEERPDTVYGGTYLYCACPGWKFSKGMGKDKDCAHTRGAKCEKGVEPCVDDFHPRATRMTEGTL